MFVVRDDQLPTAAMRDAMLRAELVEKARAVDAVAGLETSSWIVDAGVNDLAVARARATPRARLALEHAHAPSLVRDRQRAGQTYNACTNDCDVNLFHGLGPHRLEYDEEMS